MKKRILLAILIAAQLSSLACGDTVSQTSDDTTTADTTVSEETVEEELTDDLPDVRYDGTTFTMFIRNHDAFFNEMYIEESDSDLMNDAIYERNRRVEERFGVEFDVVRSSGDYGAQAKDSILAGDDTYDLLVVHARSLNSYAQENLLYDWNDDLKYIDLDKPWWSQDARKNLSIGGRLYSCPGDITYLTLGSTNAMLFNKQVAEDIKIEGLYQTAIDGKWTFDYFTQLCKDVARDLNGDDQIKINDDLVGYATAYWVGAINILYSGGQRVATKDENDELVLTLNSERTIEIFEKFFDFTDSEAGYVQQENDGVKYTDLFSEGKLLFTDMNLRNISTLRDMNTDFGILPWPKFDENVDKYYSNVDAGSNLLCVPITAKDPEMVSIILEALAADSHSNVIQKYYEVTLQTKYSRDDESVKMLDLINEGIVFDIDYFYGLSDLGSVGRYLATSADRSFSSYYAANEAAALTKYEKFNELYRN